VKLNFYIKKNYYKESTRKTEEKLGGMNKEGHEQKKPK
jgi:hypothetical protein